MRDRWWDGSPAPVPRKDLHETLTPWFEGSADLDHAAFAAFMQGREHVKKPEPPKGRPGSKRKRTKGVSRELLRGRLANCRDAPRSRWRIMGDSNASGARNGVRESPACVSTRMRYDWWKVKNPLYTQAEGRRAVRAWRQVNMLAVLYPP
jgi:hypothetical protein